MTREKWGFIVLLIIASTFLLSFNVPPAAQPSPAVPSEKTLIPTPAETATPMPLAAVLTPWPSVEPTHTPTREATQTPTLAPEKTPTEIPSPTPSPAPTLTPTPWPFDTRPDLPRYLYVDQATQHLYVFERGTLVRDIPCSTGLPYSNTYTPAWSGVVGEYWGTFFAYGVYADEAWYLYKSDGSILIHSLPYTVTVEGGPKEYFDAEALGVRPASHGCIRISPEDAIWLTQWGPEGVPITVSDPYREKWLAILGPQE